MKFKVTDNKTGKEANICRIARKEEWAKDLMCCEMEGFALMEDGSLILCDECERFVYCPENRFIVEVQNENKELSTTEKLLWLINKEWGIHPLYQCVYYQYYDVTDDGLTRFYYGARNEKTFKEAINAAYDFAVKEEL